MQKQRTAKSIISPTIRPLSKEGSTGEGPSLVFLFEVVVGISKWESPRGKSRNLLLWWMAHDVSLVIGEKYYYGRTISAMENGVLQ